MNLIGKRKKSTGGFMEKPIQQYVYKYNVGSANRLCSACFPNVLKEHAHFQPKLNLTFLCFPIQSVFFKSLWIPEPVFPRD